VALISSDFVFFSISMGTGFPWISHLRFLFKVPLKFKSRDFGACVVKNLGLGYIRMSFTTECANEKNETALSDAFRTLFPHVKFCSPYGYQLK
jgi:hypothetical protein